MAEHLFVDETKERGFLLTAVRVRPQELDIARKAVRELVLPGQRRLHFTSERDSRRRQALGALMPLAVDAMIYDAGSRPRRQQRELCLRRLVADAISAGVRMIVLEQDDSVMELDRRLLFQRVRELDCDSLEYRHFRATEEPLLAIPDAVAWCWQRGGPWRARVRPLVSAVQTV
ncbi:hypothetical protein [Labedaea rhizosphaerae]|uniref:Uncharacterized protein n=1 Tax=Labedaea rhizosphaerae TaxID=598644 RepID=A0A4R6SNI2_LABRH|nr:hypothetical protein [Labedaea rhizosphaerae]TDQ05607.1 hypothetical protein EV186_1011581 [Labedaea rhizosphaerae]